MLKYISFLSLKIVNILALIIISSILSSCFPSKGRVLDSRDGDLYDKTGFKPAGRPGERAQPDSADVQVVPDYYYQVVDPTQPKVVKTIPQRYAPASRYYNNPYALKPPANFPYYDSDQYYVPPRGLNNSNSVNINSRNSYSSGYRNNYYDDQQEGPVQRSRDANSVKSLDAYF